MLTIVDGLASVDNLIEEHLLGEPINEYVQSCDIVAFNKICRYIQTVFCFIISQGWFVFGDKTYVSIYELWLSYCSNAIS